LKIAIVVTPCLPCRTDLEYGGIERVVAYLAEGLAKEHEVTLIAGKGSKVKGVELITPTESRYSLPGENRELEMWLKAGIEPKDYDVMDFHTHLAPPVRADNVVWSIHDLLPPHPIFPFKLVARSKFHAEWLEKKWGYPTSYVYNCIDVSEFEPSEKEDYLLFLSRITRGKGVFNLVEIAKKFPEQRFVIAGEDRVEKGMNPFELTQLFKILPDNCEYLGFVNDREKKELLSRAKALLLPYDNSVYQEVFGLIILEALASGTPVFAIRNGAVGELLGLNGMVGLSKYGYLALNISSLTKALSWFIEGKFGFDVEKLRERASKFSPEFMVSNYEKVYGEVCGKGR